MERARQQAQSYARSLPPAEIVEGRPPFLVVVDVGYTIALYAEFTRTGGHYIPFPDPHTYRLSLADLAEQSDAPPQAAAGAPAGANDDGYTMCWRSCGRRRRRGVWCAGSGWSIRRGWGQRSLRTRC